MTVPEVEINRIVEPEREQGQRMRTPVDRVFANADPCGYHGGHD